MSSLSIPHQKPRLYYGWIMVVALAITEVISWGILYYTFSIFITPMQESEGWSRSALTGAFSLALLMNGIAGTYMGRLLDRHGARWLMTLGSCAALLLILAWSAVTSLTGLYLVWAGIGVAMAMVLYEPAFAVIATWFIEKRGKAITLLTFIGGLASVIFIPLSNRLIEAHGWREALVILAIILGSVTIPIHALFLRRHPHDLGLLPDGVIAGEKLHHTIHLERSIPLKIAMEHASFWWLTGAFMLSTFTGVAMMIHLSPYLVDNGYSTTFAASAAGAVGLMSLPGRLVFTWIGDYLPRRWVTAFVFGLQPCGFLAMVTISGESGIMLGIALFGLAFGALTPARAALIAEYYGSASYGTINGMLAFFVTFARAVAPVSTGIAHDAVHSYDPVLWGLVFISLAASFILPLAKPIPHAKEELSTIEITAG